MESKSLLYGLIGFFLGGLIVSVAAAASSQSTQTKNDGMSMNQMATSLKDKSGEEYDKAFVSGMILHHQGAIDMAKLSATHAKHNEIKQLSKDIITAQENEIQKMKQWQIDWNYPSGESTMKGMNQ